MKKKSVNTTQRLGKKIFIAGKVYDLQVMDKDEVEASVQEYLDSAIGKDKVRFGLCTIGNMTTMSFHRGFDYSSYNADPAKDMMDADAFMMTARLCKLNCVMLYSHSISSVGERPAPRGGTTRPDECKITTI